MHPKLPEYNIDTTEMLVLTHAFPNPFSDWPDSTSPIYYSNIKVHSNFVCV